MKFWQHSIDKPMCGENRFEIHSMTNFPSDSACGLVNILMEYFLGNFDGELLLIWLFWQMNDQRGSWVPNKWFISTLQAADTKKCYQIRRMEISRYENLIKTPRERMHSIDRQGLGLADKIIFPHLYLLSTPGITDANKCSVTENVTRQSNETIA